MAFVLEIETMVMEKEQICIHWLDVVEFICY